MIKPQNIFVFHHTCLALTVAVGLFLPTEGEHFGPSPGVGDAWPTAIQIHWCNCFLYCVFFFFSFFPALAHIGSSQSVPMQDVHVQIGPINGYVCLRVCVS